MLPARLGNELAAATARATPGFFAPATAVCRFGQRRAADGYNGVEGGWNLSASAERSIAGAGSDEHTSMFVGRSQGLLIADLGPAIAVADNLRSQLDGCIDGSCQIVERVVSSLDQQNVAVGADGAHH